MVSRGETVSAHKDHLLFLRDRVETAADGKALLVYLETARVRLKEKTQVEVLSKGLRVKRGDTWFNVVKRDTELKLLLGCTPDEAALVLRTHNSDLQAAILIPRP